MPAHLSRREFLAASAAAFGFCSLYALRPFAGAEPLVCCCDDSKLRCIRAAGRLPVELKIA